MSSDENSPESPASPPPAPAPPAGKKRFIRNEQNSPVSITWGAGAFAVEFPRRGSLAVDDLPEGFLALPDVLRRLKSTPPKFTIYDV